MPFTLEAQNRKKKLKPIEVTEILGVSKECAQFSLTKGLEINKLSIKDTRIQVKFLRLGWIGLIRISSTSSMIL